MILDYQHSPIFTMKSRKEDQAVKTKKILSITELVKLTKMQRRNKRIKVKKIMVAVT